MSRIFVTVGAQMPFDRLVHAVDRWARSEGIGNDVLAQIGNSAHPPHHIRWVRFLSPSEFDRAYDQAELIVAHAGTGSLLCAIERGTPIVVMPRQAKLRETRNDHQLATCKAFAAFPNVFIAWNEEELPSVLARAMHVPKRPHLLKASPTLIAAIRHFIDSD
ncbi:MAG: hypothetical protein NZM37_13085 [Sandaracinaceae bacterium]|nr:hypothetical protein [Sandaracinaceae bacterium]MDW8245653.1 glycosyltransferase [Sandaracinaceae bacterium]